MMKNNIFKLFLVFLFTFCCFFSIDKVYAYTSGINLPRTTFNWDPLTNQSFVVSNGAFQGYKGKLFFTVNVDTSTTSPNNAFLRGISVDTTLGTRYQCDIGTVTTNSAAKGTNVTYSAVCPVDFTNVGLYSIYLEKVNTNSIAYINFSLSATFVSDSDYAYIVDSVNGNISANSYQIQELLNRILLQEVQSQANVSANSYQILSKLQSLIDVISSGNKTIEDTLKEQNDKIQETNDTLKDDNTSESTDTAGSFFNGFSTDTHGLTGIITAPITLIGNITSSTCSSLQVPLPFVKKNLSLPCMSSIYSKYFGSFYNIYKIITFGIISYWVCVRIFNLVKDFKNPEHDEIEVMDL